MDQKLVERLRDAVIVVFVRTTINVLSTYQIGDWFYTQRSDKMFSMLVENSHDICKYCQYSGMVIRIVESKNNYIKTYTCSNCGKYHRSEMWPKDQL